MKPYLEYALELHQQGDLNKAEIAKRVQEHYNMHDRNVETLRKKISAYILKIEHKSLSDECDVQGAPAGEVSHYWLKTDKHSIFVKVDKKDPIEAYHDMRADIVAEMQKHAPVYPKLDRNNTQDGHLLVVDPADIHIGKLASSFETGDDYNNHIAVQRVLDGVRGIIQKASGFNIDKILFVGGNDILHIDTPKRTTTGGTPQDTDGMWYDNFRVAKKLYIDVIEMLISIADVHFVFNPSNHDYTNGFFLADAIESWFHNNPNITFDCSIAHRKYTQYGKNLIGTTHGDGAKTQDLPLLMAHEASKEWADSKHRYVYTHHVHHKSSKDYMGVCVESLRSPSGTDSWHHRNGYAHSPKAVEGFIHHKENGQVARLVNIF